MCKNAAVAEEPALPAPRQSVSGLLSIPPAAVALMRERLPAQTKEDITIALGISQNTWVKVRAGEPIRRSVGERLLARLGLSG